MTGKTHKAFGIAAGLGVLSIPQIRELFISNTVSVNEAATAGVLFMAGDILGSLFNDADSEDSAAGWWLYPFLRKFYEKDRSKLAKMFWHRHSLHSVWMVLALITLIVVIFPIIPFMVATVPLGFVVGLASHIFSDWIMSRVYLFSPISEKGFSLLHLEGERHKKARNVCDKVFFIFSLLADAFLVARGVIVW